MSWFLENVRPADVPALHEFSLAKGTTISSPVRRLPAKHEKMVKEEVEKMLAVGMTMPAHSAWSFRVVICTENDVKPRSCVDYCSQNQRLKADRWPLPYIEQCFDELRGNSFFTTLDMFSWYWNIR